MKCEFHFRFEKIITKIVTSHLAPHNKNINPYWKHIKSAAVSPLLLYSYYQSTIYYIHTSHNTSNDNHKMATSQLAFPCDIE